VWVKIVAQLEHDQLTPSGLVPERVGRHWQKISAKAKTEPFTSMVDSSPSNVPDF
jgi:hypothetical protein